MFTALGRLVVRRTKLTLFVSLAVVVLTAVLGSGAFTALKNGGFDDPSSDSARARVILEKELGAGSPNLLLVVTANGGDVDAPEAAAAGRALSQELTTTAGIDEVTSYWLLGSPPPLRSESGGSALVMARAGGSEAEVEATVARVQDSLEGDRGAVTVQVGGSAAVDAALGHTLEDDLVRAELIAIPLTLLLLLIVFRGVVAALLPLLVGVAAVMGAFFVLWAFAQFTDVSVFSINLVTALGIGLAIDYSLLIVSRFREELKAGYDPKVATIRTVESAGRTVVFSGVTVAVALLSLIAFPMFFLRSFAYAGVGVVLVAIAASVIILPAVLALLGHRVNAWRLPGLRRDAEGGSRRWAALAGGVLRRPGLVTGTAVVLLLLLSAPVLGTRFGNPDARVLPADVAARQATEAAQRDFGYEALPIVIKGAAERSDIEAYAQAASRVSNVTEVDTRYGTWAGGQRTAGPGPEAERYATDAGQWLEVVPAVQPISSEAENVVHDLRAIDAPFDALVSGSTAELVDTKAGITSVAPWAALWIAVATFALLFLMFGSLLVPLKAIVLNTLNLTAMLGAMVWIFQDGNLSELLSFTSTGLTDVSMPLLMFAVAFGLSMDYEVFLLARMKEEYDRTGDNETAIVSGIANTGPIVTAAALVLSITFFAFGTAGVTFMKMFGLGLGLAVLIDAFLVRATLVPALMKMAGRANWWAPAWARRLHEKAGIDETGGTLSTTTGPAAREPQRVG
ncbi:membrane protein [Paractinoplanes abujensis]|uniref:RND superfamily putative drug exporter n=1 Tax=Paractinoplanes abujensis TaxID=882441 RepID=A0A7W7CR45_9ACTN|nr:MMPL family transporter [Actinoplanes abujensis]MBB4693196.1 RND superfamily putative drug exporter [Actinoplanes abujensis]GID24395.1 membrane protein [Actinoplanes abujensis]